MKKFITINVAQAHLRWKQGSALLIDIRDQHSYLVSHAPGALHLANDKVQSFIRQTDFTKPLMVMCYHGNNSRDAAQYLLEQGFAAVYSVDGGFTAWAKQYPRDVTTK
ncbi:thiosulfate sulfurtransferase GlpE [Candidatus Fukatsuia endosymbiont of Tuberolachnus salignus]|uniref:thiosulfate sulfurtransferase GlpE n=1 Tax=Candidatus Fukatsuia endosymbiont of Tuberolachnus salignus TaxID=3077957 RepID=UPI00313BE05C